MGKWYPAKVVEVDDSDNTVLIHFDGWNQRYDEWLDMDSERIRPMTRHSERRERREKSKVVVKPPTVLYCHLHRPLLPSGSNPGLMCLSTWHEKLVGILLGAEILTQLFEVKLSVTTKQLFILPSLCSKFSSIEYSEMLLWRAEHVYLKKLLLEIESCTLLETTSMKARKVTKKPKFPVSDGLGLRTPG